jgi:hypothetical protein
MTVTTDERRSAGRGKRYFRKQLVLPAEHGSWSWLLVPYFVGLAVAGVLNLPLLLVLIGGLAGFLMRQPATAWMRIRTGRGRRADETLARGWTVGLGLLALLCLAGLLALGRSVLLWLLAPLAVILVVYLVAALRQRSSLRALWMELAGAAGLADMAPAAYVAASTELDAVAWGTWGLMAGQNALGVLYVRLRIADTHGRPMARTAVVLGHGLVLLLVIAAIALRQVPWLAAVPFAGFLLRSIWAAARVRPLENIKRFGFTEVAVELVGGALVVLGYWLA